MRRKTRRLMGRAMERTKRAGEASISNTSFADWQRLSGKRTPPGASYLVAKLAALNVMEIFCQRGK